MTTSDLMFGQLRRSRSTVSRPSDLGRFWASTLDESRAVSVAPSAVRRPGLAMVATFDVSFSGFGGRRIRAWLHRAEGLEGDLPTVVRYTGYDSGRGLPHVISPFVLAGYAVLTMDNRGQGALEAYPGDTADDGQLLRQPGGHAVRGIEGPDSYYYRRLFTDAVLAVDAARAIDGIDPERIAVQGMSQGGATAIAAAALSDGITGAMIDVPFLSDVPRALKLAMTPPYSELAAFVDGSENRLAQVLTTTAYFDASVLAGMATAPALFSVAFMDPVCPPSTVYAAYNAYAGQKSIREYPENGHEGGSFTQEAAQLAWLASTMPTDVSHPLTATR